MKVRFLHKLVVRQYTLCLMNITKYFIMISDTHEKLGLGRCDVIGQAY